MNTTTVKKKLSGASIVSMICAIIFSIAAACMIFLPVVSPEASSDAAKTLVESMSDTQKTTGLFPLNRNQKDNSSTDLWGNGNSFDLSVIGTTGSNFMKASSYISDNKDYILKTDAQKKRYTMNLIEVIAATAAFFGLIAVAVFVLLGKLLQSKKGGRVLALIFSIIGALIGGGYLVTTILYTNAYNDVITGDIKAVIGIGPIIMAACSVLAAVFCFIGLGKSAYKKSSEPAPVPAGFDPSQQPVPPVQQPVQNFAPVQQPVQPVQPMQPVQPVQHMQPVQPVQSAQQVTPPAYAGQKATIEGIKGDYKGAEIDLEPNEKLVIGRDPTSCNIVVSSANKDISRMHCSVWYDPEKDAFKVMDTSSNGTFVGDQKLPRDKKVQVPDNTIISLGSGENQFILRKKQ